jgi:hypothetical protein
MAQSDSTVAPGVNDLGYQPGDPNAENLNEVNSIGA